MSGQDTQICCCGASTWTAVFGWIQTVLSALAAIGSAVQAANFDDSSFDPEDKKLAQGLAWAIVALLVVDVLHRSTGCDASKGFSVSMGVVNATTTGDVGQTISVGISAAVAAFIIYCVYRRIQDIKIDRTNGKVYNGV